MGLKVFPYTLDDLGDSAFPHAIPALAEVVRTFFSSDMPDVMNRIHHNLMIATQ
ncbi:TPA: hypothetical protein ACS730_004019 [Providencia alcalifaciens]|uniref:hypothetical protein n=1 Tax=Providencia alcalifaciens TaxID=126385 RepID=UPI001CC72ADB